VKGMSHGEELFLPSFPQKRESIFASIHKIKMDSRFRGNDDTIVVVLAASESI